MDETVHEWFVKRLKECTNRQRRTYAAGGEVFPNHAQRECLGLTVWLRCPRRRTQLSIPKPQGLQEISVSQL
ncbi:hypothetical protein AOLI_G00312990 [Acnodon oligacanthus]